MVQAKIRDQSVRLCPVILPPACQKKARPSTTISTPHVFLFHLRNRGNDELSKRSNCSVRQGIKGCSAEEHNQYILTPQRVNQQVHALSSSRVIVSSLRKLCILQQISNIPRHIIQTFLTSIPGSLDLRLFPGGLPNVQRRHFPSAISKIFPRKVQPNLKRFPQESLNPSP